MALPALALAALGSGGGAAGGAAAGAATAAASAGTGLSASLASSLTSATKLFGTVTKGLNSATLGVNAIGQAGNALFGNIKSLISSINSQIASYVKLSNPAAFNQFNLAVDDLNASIGRILVPVLNIATGIIRQIGDAFASLGEGGQTLVKILSGGFVFETIGKVLQAVLPAIVELFDELGPVLKSVQEAVGPIIGMFTSAFRIVINYVTQVVAVFSPIIQLFAVFQRILGQLFQIFGSLFNILVSQLIGGLLRLVAVIAKLGLELWIDALTAVADFVEKKIIPFIERLSFGGRDTTKAGSSFGAGVRQTSIGDISSFITKAQTSAFSSGVGASNEKKTADATEQTAKNTAKIVKIVELMSVANKVATAPLTAANATLDPARWLMKQMDYR